MNPVESSDPTAAALISLRNEPDAVRAISERLKVKEMGPADHIRTKHEVKQFVEAAGDVKAAEELLRRAGLRRKLSQSVSAKISQIRGENMSQ